MEEGGYTISEGTDVIYTFLIQISTGEIHFDEIVEWLNLYATTL